MSDTTRLFKFLADSSESELRFIKKPNEGFTSAPNETLLLLLETIVPDFKALVAINMIPLGELEEGVLGTISHPYCYNSAWRR